MTEGTFFQDLAMLMTVAGISAIVFARFGWPKVIGYILSGIVMSEYTWGGSFLHDPSTTRTIGQLGIVFLMFGMGLSFSPREMRRIRPVALPAACLDTVVMIWLGYTVGTRLFGWNAVQSVFLGVAICDSATTLLAKVLDEMKWTNRPFAKYVLGTSVCEDIICVGAIAVATGFAKTGAMSASAFFFSLFGLGAFFLTVLVFGFVLVPRLLSSVVHRSNDDEVLVLTLLGCCFFVTYFAYRFDFSLALGAFLVGIIGGSSDVRDRLERLTFPLKAMFSAVFFVSIGLLVDPAALWHALPQILLVSALVIGGKFINVFIASLVTGLDIKTAVQNGFGLAQIGEFAFMVAILYAGIVEDATNEMFPVAIGVSLLTTFLNPLLIRLSDRVGDFAENHQPRHFRDRLQTYQAWVEKIRAEADTPSRILLRNAAFKLGVYAVLVVSVSIVCANLPRFDYSRFSETFERHDSIIFFLLGNLFCVALLPMILFAARAIGDEVASLLLGSGEFRWRVPLQKMVRFFLVSAILALFLLELTMINIALAPKRGQMVWFGIAIVAVIGVFGWRFFMKTGRRAMKQFSAALTAEERREGLVKMMTVSVPEGTIHRFTLEASSPAVGLTVGSLNIRAKTGATVVSIIRNGLTTRNIGPEWDFQVGDTLVTIGEAHEIAALKDLLGIIL